MTGSTLKRYLVEKKENVTSRLIDADKNTPEYEYLKEQLEMLNDIERLCINRGRF